MSYKDKMGVASYLRYTVIDETEKAVLLFDSNDADKGGYGWIAREKKDDWNYKQLSSPNYAVAKKRFEKYNQTK